MFPFIRELVVVEGIHDERSIKQTVHATTLVLDGWGAKRVKISQFLKRAEATGKGIIFFLDSDKTGTDLESYLLSCLNFPKKALVAMLDEEISTKHKKIGVEHAKPKEILKALKKAGVTFLNQKPLNHLSKQDLSDLGLKDSPRSVSRRAKVEEFFGLTKGNAKRLLTELNFLEIKRCELETILDKMNLF